MGRPKRAADGGIIYHVLNRANARLPIFEKDGDYEAFEKILEEAVERTETRLLAYCILHNHWHLVVWPREDGELSRFTRAEKVYGTVSMNDGACSGSGKGVRNLRSMNQRGQDLLFHINES